MNDMHEFNIVPLPRTVQEALALIARCEFEDDNICELGDNLIVLKSEIKTSAEEYTLYIFTEEPNDDGKVEEVTFKIAKVG